MRRWTFVCHLFWQRYHFSFLFLLMPLILVLFLLLLFYRCQIIYRFRLKWIMAVWNNCTNTSNAFARNTFIGRDISSLTRLTKFVLNNVITIRWPIEPLRILASKEHLLELFFPSELFIGFHLNECAWFQSSTIKKYITHSYSFCLLRFVHGYIV